MRVGMVRTDVPIWYHHISTRYDPRQLGSYETQVHQSCRTIPLKNGICPYKDIRRIQGPAQNELEEGPRNWVRLLLI
jgi:hypothetical protein